MIQNFVQVLTSPETNLCRTDPQDVPYAKAAPPGPPLQLPLFRDKGLVFSPARFNFAPTGQLLLYKPIQELVQQLEGSNVIPTNHNCRDEAAHTLSYERFPSNSSQQTIHKLLEKATGIAVKLNPQILAPNFVQCSHHACAGRKVFFINCRKPQMIWGHVFRPLF